MPNNIVTMLDNLRHMLGIDTRLPRKKWGYRNYYAASVLDTQEMDDLVSHGLARKSCVRDGLVYYHATLAGAVAAGLTFHEATVLMAAEVK